MNFWGVFLSQLFLFQDHSELETLAPFQEEKSAVIPLNSQKTELHMWAPHISSYLCNSEPHLNLFLTLVLNLQSPTGVTFPFPAQVWQCV